VELMPRQPETDNIRAIYDHLTSLQISICDALDGPPNRFRADSVALLRVLEDYYQRNLYPRLVKRG
jgi:hypothetical protein